MTGLDWVKKELAYAETDHRLNAVAYDVVDSITVPSRLKRKAMEYQAARRAFYEQLAKNGIFAS